MSWQNHGGVGPGQGSDRREEKPGWALGFASVGSVALLASLFLPWFQAKFWVTFVEDDGPLEDESRLASPFTAVSTVEDVTAPDPGGPEPGVLAQAVFPWLALVLLVVCCALALAAAVGLGSRRRTGAVRIATVATLLLTAGLLIAASYDLGVTSSPGSSLEPTGPVPGAEDAEVSSIRGYVDPYGTIAVAAVGGLLLAIAAIIGPRVPRSAPAPGWTPPQYGQPQYGQPQYGPPQQGAPQYGPPPGTPPCGPPPAPKHRTQLGAVILTGLAALLCFAGYVFLHWGKKTTFADISSATREYGFDDKPISEAYFAWLGWVVLLMVIGAAVVVLLGRIATVLNPRRMRPIVGSGAVLAVLVHLWTMIDMEDADFGIGFYATALGLVLAAVGSLLPLRSSYPTTAP